MKMESKHKLCNYNWEAVVLLAALRINCPTFERPHICEVFIKLNLHN